MKTQKVLLLMAVTGVTSSLTGHAQSYEDDIYYTEPSKKETKKAATSQSTPSSSGERYGTTTVYDYPSADTYSVPHTQGRAIIDVETYNRRGLFATDTISANDMPQ